MARTIIAIFQLFFRANRAAATWIAKRFPNQFGRIDYEQQLLDIIQEKLQTHTGLAHVLEIGGADRPLLTVHNQIRYDGLDIVHHDLCDLFYDHFYQQSAEKPFPNHDYHLIFSHTTLEYIPDVQTAYQNMYASLQSGGMICHYHLCKGHPYARILRMIGYSWQKKLRQFLNPESVMTTNDHSYFDRATFGEAIHLLCDVGYVDIAIRPYYRANHHFDRFLPAFLAVSIFENLAERYDLPQFCSGIIVSARKP